MIKCLLVIHVMEHTRIHEKGELSLLDLLKSVRNRPDFNEAGALAMFIGVVRGKTPDNETVKKIEVEAYEEKANEIISNICKELMEKDGVIEVQIHHFIGEFDVGDDLVYVVVAGSHRNKVFQVLEEAVERYKKEAIIFKKEYIIDKKGTDKSYWINELRSEEFFGEQEEG